MNITPVRIYINGNGSISFYGTNNTLITNLQNLNGAKSTDGQIIFDGDDKTISFYVYQLTAIESATFSLPYSPLDSRFFNPSTYSAKLNQVYRDVAEYVLVNKNGGASFVGGVVAVYPNFASFPATGQEAVIYIDEGTNQAYFWDGTSYQLLVSTGVQQYANFASFPVTGSANVIYVDMSVPEPYVWNGTAYESLHTAAISWGEITGTLSNQTDLQAALDDKVPYTGATTDVDLGEFELKAGQIEFDQTPTGTAGVAVMRWNDSDGTLDLGLKGGNVTLQVGQESVLRVVNKTATNVNLLEANYQAVRVTGAQGQRLKVDLALATTDGLSAETIGLVTETINNNQEGFITTSGLVRGINTTGSLQGETWADGDILYLSPTTAGMATKVKPTAPNHLIILGYVIHAHINQGSIFVKVDNGYELDELHNVKITTAANNNVLAYTSATDLWENKTVATALGYTPVPETRTLTINGTTQDLSANRTFTIATGLEVFTTPITGGAVGRILFEGAGNVLRESANLFWDNTNARLGIGTTSPTTNLQVGTTSTSNTKIQIASDGFSSTSGLELVRGGSTWNIINNGNFTIQRGGTTYLNVATTGNVGINTTTDAGFKLDVNGTARILNNLTVGNSASLWRIVMDVTSGSNPGGYLNWTLSDNFTYYRQYNQSGFHNYETTSASGYGHRWLTEGSVSMVLTNSRNLLIGTTTNIASSKLTVTSTTQGFLPPRMTTTQKNAIASPASGLVVYDTTLNKLCVYTTAWETITSV